MLREYELGLVINPDLSEEQLEAQMLRIGQTIEGQGGTITHLDKWGRRRLSYPIGRHRDGYYAFIDMQLESLSVRDIERVLLVQEEVMRHLITFIDPRALAERRRRQELEATRAALAAQRAEAIAHANAEAAAAQAAQAANAQAAPTEAITTETTPAQEATAKATPVEANESAPVANEPATETPAEENPDAPAAEEEAAPTA